MITTVIPTFKRPKYLRRAIESVLAQSFKDFKICVYDNASGDETEDIVKDYVRRDRRVFYFKNSQNIGPVKNMAQGMDAVDTSFCSILNDDDFLLPDFYESAIDAFKKYPQAGFVCAKTIMVDLINGKVQFRNKDWMPGLYEPSNETIYKMYSSHFTQTAILLRRNISQSIGAFEASGDDGLYMTIAAALYPFAVVNNYGGVFILHGQSYTLIRTEDFSTLYKDLLLTTGNIIKTDLPEERKAYLLMLALNSYQKLFYSKKLSHFMAKHCENKIMENIFIPSYVNTTALLTRAYEIFPKRLHSIITGSLSLIRHLRGSSLKKITSSWAKLPEGADSFLFSLDSDASKFMSYFKEGFL